MPKPTKSKSKKPTAKPAPAAAEQRWDVLIYELATNKVTAIAGQDLRESGSFHTVSKRVDLVYTRINEHYSVVKVPTGKYALGAILEEADAKPA